MAARKKKTDGDTATERPYAEAQADPKRIEEVEDRQPDQIPDYHQKHPTLRLKASQEPEPETQD